MPTMITRGAASARAFGLFKAVSGAVTDAYFKYVTMLLPGNGTNGAQNNTFLDSSTNNFSITRNGNTTQGTFAPYGSNWSNYFTSASSQYLKLPSSTSLAAGSGDFTIEAWVFMTGGSTYNSLYETRATTGDSAGFVFSVSQTDGVYMYNGTAGVIVSSGASTVPINEWHHVAVSRSGSSLRAFVDGVLKSTVTNSTNFSSYGKSNIPIIGAGYEGGSDYFSGYISNFRLVKGTAVYTATFTPSTTPLTAITNTSVLTCQSNRFIDNSTNAFAITLNGSPSVQVFSPFSPSAAYSTTTNGGSGYFDGSGDYLSVADNAAFEVGSGSFTLECWFYATGSVPANGAALVSKSNTSAYGPYSIAISPTAPYYLQSLFSSNGASWDIQIVTTVAYATLKNSWHHVAVVRNGTTFTLYLDGVSVGTATSSATLIDNTNNFQISYINYVNTEFPGYITDVRLVKGTAVYTGAFTPPTAPLTAISNTSFLCSFTNAGIIDNAMMNDLETLGNAQISTTQSKFGGSSMKFDGTGDNLNVSNGINSPLWDFYKDFTIEMWIYPTAYNVASGAQLIGAHNSGVGNDWLFMMGGTGRLEFFNGATSMNTGSNICSLNTWTHVAAVRSGTTVTLYINGTSGGTGTFSSSLLTANYPVTVGADNDASASTFTGYIDDLRITNGYARYTANFTAPTAAFPTQ